jgi:cytochrome bd ubiquinol oxidase subunit I
VTNFRLGSWGHDDDAVDNSRPLATGASDGRVAGLRDFAPQDQPPLLPLLFYAFRVMAGIGFALFVLMLWTAIAWLRGWLDPPAIDGNRLLMRAWVAAVPLGYIAVLTGWTVREVGRQPWIIFGLLRTSDAVSVLPAPSVAFTAAGYLLIDALLLVLFVVFAARTIRKGPDLTLLPPEREPLIQDVGGHRANATER